MPIGLLKNIIDRKPPVTRLLGLDIGAKTLGLAVSDPGQGIATPLHTIFRTKFTKDIQALKTVIHDYEIGGFVLGWPVSMDGSEGPRCDAVRSFADEMTRHPDVFGEDPWIALWDERLSTVSVEDLVGDFVDINKAKHKGIIDKLAAQVILQGALDFIRVAA